jgi:hypothetical protein
MIVMFIFSQCLTTAFCQSRNTLYNEYWIIHIFVVIDWPYSYTWEYFVNFMLCRRYGFEIEANIYQISGINISIAVIRIWIICVSIKTALQRHFDADLHILNIHKLFKFVTKLFIGEMRDNINVPYYNL